MGTMASGTLLGTGPFAGEQKVTPLSPPPGLFHISVTMLMKLPASWHISFHSGHQDSVEKYIPRLPPQLWFKQGTNPIPSPVNSSWDPNPLDCFIYLQNTVNLKAPYDPTLWQSLTFGGGGGCQGDNRSSRTRHGHRVMERGTRRGTDRQRGSKGPERLGGEEGERERPEGSAGTLLCTNTSHSHRQQRERERSG